MAEYEWQRIARAIEEEIRSGRIPLGGALSSITRLAETYGVADRTIRRALRDLRERGLIETLPHKGSYVVDALPPVGASEDGDSED
ncbi:winged helix-turn-helix domain-containing protein [Streptomyces sp. NPDC127039]|uniref:winged helix-turn-helix domain-containing protein n=1 Tax=Streptomyces sp. NPDC127039 TaxID=3347115 RepID=UPI003649D4E8